MFPAERSGVKGQSPDWVMQKMCFFFHPFKRVSFSPWVWEPRGDERSGISHPLLPSGPPQPAAPGGDAHLLHRTARNVRSCLFTPLSLDSFHRLLSREFVCVSVQGNCGLSENTSKYNPKVGFPQTALLSQWASVLCPALAVAETEQKQQAFALKTLASCRGGESHP